MQLKSLWDCLKRGAVPDLDKIDRHKMQALLFDKDGTLFHFRATWEVWMAQTIHDLSGGDPDLAQRLGDAVLFDITTQEFSPLSPVIAGTGEEASRALHAVLPDRDYEQLHQDLMISSAQAPLAPAANLGALLDELRGMGLKLGVMTNDAEISAKAHLKSAQIEGAFDFVAGFDSGFGAKPSPEPLLAFAQAVGVAPEHTAMIGDSTHDLIAGRAAGMATIGVLTGLALPPDLEPYADVILPDIGHLPQWLTTNDNM